MINYPEFAVAPHAHHDLIELRVIVDSVHVVPELLDHHAGAVRIDAFHIVADHAVVAPPSGEVLDQVIPRMPLPDDDAAVRADGLDLGHIVREHEAAAAGDRRIENRGVEAGGQYLGCALHLTNDHDDIAVGKHLEIVV